MINKNKQYDQIFRKYFSKCKCVGDTGFTTKVFIMNNYTQLFLHSCIVDNLTFIKIYVAFIQILFLISLSTCRGDYISCNAGLLCTSISKMKRPVLKRSTLFIVTSEKTYKLKKGRKKLRKTEVMLIHFCVPPG